MSANQPLFVCFSVSKCVTVDRQVKGIMGFNMFKSDILFIFQQGCSLHLWIL